MVLAVKRKVCCVTLLDGGAPGDRSCDAHILIVAFAVSDSLSLQCMQAAFTSEAAGTYAEPPVSTDNLGAGRYQLDSDGNLDYLIFHTFDLTEVTGVHVHFPSDMSKAVRFVFGFLLLAQRTGRGEVGVSLA